MDTLRHRTLLLCMLAMTACTGCVSAGCHNDGLNAEQWVARERAQEMPQLEIVRRAARRQSDQVLAAASESMPKPLAMIRGDSVEMFWPGGESGLSGPAYCHGNGMMERASSFTVQYEVAWLDADSLHLTSLTGWSHNVRPGSDGSSAVSGKARSMSLRDIAEIRLTKSMFPWISISRTSAGKNYLEAFMIKIADGDSAAAAEFIATAVRLGARTGPTR